MTEIDLNRFLQCRNPTPVSSVGRTNSVRFKEMYLSLRVNQILIERLSVENRIEKKQPQNKTTHKRVGWRNI